MSLVYEQEFDIVQFFNRAEKVVLYEYAKSEKYSMFVEHEKRKAAGKAKMQRRTVMKSECVAGIEPFTYAGVKDSERDKGLSYKACLSKNSRFLYERKRQRRDCLECYARNPNP